MKLVRAAFTRSMLAAALLASTAASVGAADPYEVNVLLPMTGSGAFIGQDAQVGLRLIEGMVNRSGGIGGRPLRFVIGLDVPLGERRFAPHCGHKLQQTMRCNRAHFACGRVLTASRAWDAATVGKHNRYTNLIIFLRWPAPGFCASLVLFTRIGPGTLT